MYHWIKGKVIRMTLTREEEEVLGAIAGLSGEDMRVPVLISSVHHAFRDMNVSDLVPRLGVLLERGLIRNARPTKEKISNMYVLTPEGQDYCLSNIRKL
jgi:chromosome segregation and condensation protein ScpB